MWFYFGCGFGFGFGCGFDLGLGLGFDFGSGVGSGLGRITSPLTIHNLRTQTKGHNTHGPLTASAHGVGGVYLLPAAYHHSASNLHVFKKLEGGNGNEIMEFMFSSLNIKQVFS